MAGRKAMRFINDATWKYQFPSPADPETLCGIMEELIIPKSNSQAKLPID
jgi:hypothetical protein